MKVIGQLVGKINLLVGGIVGIVRVFRTPNDTNLITKGTFYMVAGLSLLLLSEQRKP